MSDMPAHTMESAIVDALTQGLEAVPVSLPPESVVLGAARDSGAPVPSEAAMAGVAEVMGEDEFRAPGGITRLLSNRWTYVAGAVVVLMATIGVVAGLQLHQGASGSASGKRPSASAPSGGGGSQPVGGVPSSTPLATATPSPQLVASPPPTVAPTPAPSTPAPTPPSTPVPAAPPAPVAASTPPPATSAPAQASTPPPSAGARPTPSTHPSPTPPGRCVLVICFG